MNAKYAIKTNQGSLVSNPPIAQLLFEDRRFAIVWLVVRLMVGYSWLTAGLHKLQSPAWMQTGEALKGFWVGAVTPTASGSTPAAIDWYRNFLQGMLDAGSYVWFAKLVAVGEFVIGAALILGLFVGIAAFFGGFMSWNFVMAGTASINPMMFVGAILLILAWKTAGYYGVDRYLLPRLGTPWALGKAETSAPTVPQTSSITA